MQGGCRPLYSAVIQTLVCEKNIETSVGSFFPDHVTRLNFLIKENWCGLCVCVSLSSERIDGSEALGHAEPSFVTPKFSRLDFLSQTVRSKITSLRCILASDVFCCHRHFSLKSDKSLKFETDLYGVFKRCF